MARQPRILTLITINLIFFFAQPVFAQSPTSTEIVYKKVSDSIFTIYGIATEGEKPSAFGSAVAIDKNLLATNCHVANSGNVLFIFVNNQYKLASLIYHNDNDDFCIVSVDNVTFRPVQIRPSNQVQIGEEVVAIGNPNGYQKSISKGIISNKYDKNNLPLELDYFYTPLIHICKNDNYPVLQTDAPISHGSSGGGLFDQDGNLIGITTSGDSRGENLGFAIPTELILKITNPIRIATDNQSVNQPESIKRTEVQPHNIQNTTTIITPKNTATLIGYYGKSKIGLFKLNNSCFIAITGYYRPNKPTSTALWYPNDPNNLFIFSRVITLDKATQFMIDKNNFQYLPSKSSIFIENYLYPLLIISFNNEKNLVYLFNINKNLSELFIQADYFLSQFYHFNNQSGMTTIEFNLDGFTEALSAYNQSCKK